MNTGELQKYCAQLLDESVQVLACATKGLGIGWLAGGKKRKAKKMKYRIEPKPGKRIRYRALFESEDLAAVRAWIARPPVPVTTRVYGSDGTGHKLVTPDYHDIIVSCLCRDTAAMDANGNVPLRWMEARKVSTVATRDTEEGRHQIAIWQGKTHYAHWHTRSLDGGPRQWGKEGVGSWIFWPVREGKKMGASAKEARKVFFLYPKPRVPMQTLAQACEEVGVSLSKIEVVSLPPL